MPSPRPSALLEDVKRRAHSEGLNLCGVVSAAEFDRCQPPGKRAQELFPDGATILVIASGGRAFWQTTCGDHQPPPRPGREAGLVDRRCSEVVEELSHHLAGHGHANKTVYPDDRPTLNFPRMGEMAGLGTVSPVLGMLLHPDFGLWVNFRAAVLIAGSPFGTDWPRAVPTTFQPCATCARPCVEACPANVYDPSGDIHLEQCAQHRHTGGCADGCDVLRACPVGAEHRHNGGEAAICHEHSLAGMRRKYGLGMWKLMPRPIRDWLC